MHSSNIDAEAGRAQALRLRLLDQAQAQLNRRIGAGLHAELPLGGTCVRLEVGGARAAGAHPPSRPLRLQTPAGVIAIAPAREVVRVLTTIDIPDDVDADPLQSLRMDVAAQAMPAGWWPLFGASSMLMAAPQEVPDAFELSLSIFQPQARLGLAVALRGSVAALLHALSQPAWQRSGDAAAGHAPDLPLPLLQVPVRIGTTALPLSTVRALAKGDVVPLTHPRFGLTGEGELRIADGLARAVLQLGNQPVLELTEWHPTIKGQTVTDLLDFPHGAPHDRGAGDTLDDLPVTLCFDLGTLELTLAQLKALGPGSVLPLAGALPPQVAIRVGAGRVGTGELVELEGGLAVEIHRMGAVS